MSAANFATLTPADCDRLLRQARHRRRSRPTLSTFARAHRAASDGKPEAVGPQKRSSGGSFHHHPTHPRS
jgi:hypothetical protein